MIVSVYLPTRNRLDKLRKAIQSVLSQDFNQIELIIVDDCSDDGTWQYLESLKVNDKRVVALRNDAPAGAQVARNRAIERASGDYLTGIDDDDLFNTSRISSMLTVMKLCERQYSSIFGVYSQDLYTINGMIVAASKKRGSVSFDDFPHGNQIGNQILAPLDVYRKSGLFDVTMPAWQDMELFVRMSKCFGTAALVDLPLYVCDKTPDPGRISKNELKVRVACRMIIDKHYSGSREAEAAFYGQMHLGYDFPISVGDISRLVRLRAVGTALRVARKAIASRVAPVSSLQI